MSTIVLKGVNVRRTPRLNADEYRERVRATMQPRMIELFTNPPAGGHSRLAGMTAYLDEYADCFSFLSTAERAREREREYSRVEYYHPAAHAEAKQRRLAARKRERRAA